MPNLQDIIFKSSNSYNLKKLISLRAFLLDEQDCPWTISYDHQNVNASIVYMQNNTLRFFLDLNTKNLTILGIKSQEIIMMPKNKKLHFVNILNDIINSFLFENEFVIDRLRSNPFSQDSFFQYMNEKKFEIDTNYWNLYQKRNLDLKDLLDKANFNIKDNYNCSQFSKELKIKNYWKYLWSNVEKYKDESIINNVIL